MLDRKKISDNTYLVNIPEEQIESLKLKRWKKDNVENLVNENGFHIKPDGRSGTIYFVENNQLCEFYIEISGVKEFDIIIYFDQLNEWVLPNKKVMLESQKESIREKLIIWLEKEKIKADL